MSLVQTLREALSQEHAQTRYYRELAARAEDANRSEDAERLYALLADEQHHVSRLTARLLELGESAQDPASAPVAVPGGPWEADARHREDMEVAWYEGALRSVGDRTTRAIFREILASERRHREVLGGKWMPAAAGDVLERHDDGDIAP